ncbi:hypothetical protein ABBQ32_012753 [Trebouxia sp. C0010 RCD-2024]
MLLRKPTRIELKPEDKEYESVKQAQAEAQARQQAAGGQQPNFDQHQGAKESVASRIGYRK